MPNQCTPRARMGPVPKPLAERFWPKVNKDGPVPESHPELGHCWLWTASTFGKGYGQILRGGKPYRTMGAHVAAYQLASGEPVPDGFDIGHTCDVRLCVMNEGRGVYVVDGVEYPRWGHLFLTTDAGNNKDMAEKGRHYSKTSPEKVARGARHGWATHPESVPRGERQGPAKLTDDNVREIRRRYATGETNKRALGREYGVSHSVIRGVVTGQTWTHVI